MRPVILPALVHGSAWCDDFAFDRSDEVAWVSCPCRMFVRAWRKLRQKRVVAKIIVPFWDFSTWWRLVVPDSVHLANEVVDWVWLDRSDPDLFVPGSAPSGRAVVPPDLQLLAVQVDFSEAGAHRRIPLCDPCLKGGCGACRSRSWTRYRWGGGGKLRMGGPLHKQSGPRGGGASGGSTNDGSLPRGGIHV